MAWLVGVLKIVPSNCSFVTWMFVDPCQGAATVKEMMRCIAALVSEQNEQKKRQYIKMSINRIKQIYGHVLCCINCIYIRVCVCFLCHCCPPILFNIYSTHHIWLPSPQPFPCSTLVRSFPVPLCRSRPILQSFAFCCWQLRPGPQIQLA